MNLFIVIVEAWCLVMLFDVGPHLCFRYFFHFVTSMNIIFICFYLFH